MACWIRCGSGWRKLTRECRPRFGEQFRRAGEFLNQTRRAGSPPQAEGLPPKILGDYYSAASGCRKRTRECRRRFGAQSAEGLPPKILDDDYSAVSQWAKRTSA